MIDSGYRRAALVLYGLSVADRNWLMTELSVDQRAKLDELLVQLKSMGLSAESLGHSNIMDELDGAPESDLETSFVNNSAENLKKIPIQEILKVLSEEPVWMTKLIYGMHARGWMSSTTMQGKNFQLDGVGSGEIPPSFRLKPRVVGALLEGLGAHLIEYQKNNAVGFERMMAGVDDTTRIHLGNGFGNWFKWKR